MPAYTQYKQYASTPEAEELTRATLAGDYVGQGNPYLDEVIANANRDVEAGLEGQQAKLMGASLRPGQFGSSVWSNQRRALQDDAAKRMADASTGARAAAYESERGRQNEVLAMQNQRDAQIWGDLTGRRGQDISARNASAAAGASRYNADMAARAQEAATRANLLLGQGQLAEEARQFDASHPLAWAQLLGGQISDYGGQDTADFNSLAGAYGQQLGLQQGAAGMGLDLAGLDLQGVGQQLQAAGMLPQYEQAGMAPLALAGDYLSSLYGSEAGLQAAKASANASRYATDLGRDQLQYGSAVDQWRYNNPQAIVNDYIAGMGGINSMAGGQSRGQGIGAPAAGTTYNTGPSEASQWAQTALGVAAMFGY